MKISGYRARHNEANFGKPIVTQIAGGSHITFEMITIRSRNFYMTRWPKGLPGHDDPPNVLRFPHGLIRFGESLEACAKRLVRQQLGMSVKSAKIAYFDSYVDDLNHWHIEPCCIVQVTGTPVVPRGASEVISFDIFNIPKMTFWSTQDFLDIIQEQLPELFKKGKT